ncbi:MAG: helix-turn-helix transcriptional regulator, partial [Firmicutes bacterium]|nr:helix-turn-helix transcriptional regulator [Bacillota bacterium]
MPKIIKDAEKQILQSATELFGQHGYHSADMKMISNK